jgi:hypothetical protein
MYQIYASGIINGQAVSLIHTLKSDPITNEIFRSLQGN